MDNNSFDRVSRALAGSASRRQALKLLGGGVVGGLALLRRHEPEPPLRSVRLVVSSR